MKNQHVIVFSVGTALALSLLSACQRGDSPADPAQSHSEHRAVSGADHSEHAHSARPEAAAAPDRADDDPVLASYLQIHRALAASSTEGVSEAAAVLAAAAGAHQGHGGSHAEVAGSLIGSVEALDGSDLASVREGFKNLSESMVRYRALMPRVADQTVVVHCSMASACWVQTAAEVQNPYHGSDMPRCGSVTKQRGEG